MEKKEIYALIESSVQNSRPQVIEALKKSFVPVNPDVSDKELFYIIEREFMNGNGFLVFHLGKVMEEQLMFADGEQKSGWVQAVAAILPALGGLFGGGDDGAAAAAQAQAQAQNQQQMMMQFQMAQQQAQEAQRRREEQARREDEERRRRSTMTIIGVVGGVVVIGGIIAIVMTRK